MKRLVFFCFCAVAALAMIPTGIARWEDGLIIESKFIFSQPDLFTPLELPGLMASDSGEFLKDCISGDSDNKTETEEQQNTCPPGGNDEQFVDDSPISWNEDTHSESGSPPNHEQNPSEDGSSSAGTSTDGTSDVSHDLSSPANEGSSDYTAESNGGSGNEASSEGGYSSSDSSGGDFSSSSDSGSSDSSSAD